MLDRNKDLSHTLEIFQKKRNGLETDQFKQILARVKVNDIGYALIQNKELETEWYKDTQLLNIQEAYLKDWKNT